MNYSPDQLYNLLPAVYRQRDAEQGSPLRALVAVIARQAEIFENDLANLYDNWFIETCDQWVVPYIGDLLGVSGLNKVSLKTFSQRSRVANTIGYRRRKGTAVMLQQLARDVTGYPARVVEFFELLTTTQNLNHLRLSKVASPDLRDANTLQVLGGPFEKTTRTVEVRHIEEGRGKYNLPNIGIYLWRLKPYTLYNSQPSPAQEGPGLFRFSQLGQDTALITRPQAEDEMSQLSKESEVPGPIRSYAFYEDLSDFARQFTAAPSDERPSGSLYYGPDASLFIIRDGFPVEPLEVVPSDLSNWDRPEKGKVAVDVCLGRFAFNETEVPGNVEVNYTYSFSGDLGSGPYNRAESLKDLTEWGISWQLGVSSVLPPVAGEIVGTLEEAVSAWNTQPPGTRGLIVIMDNYSHPAPFTSLQIPQGSKLALVAAEWKLPPGRAARPSGKFSPENLRPSILGDLRVEGTAPDKTLDQGTFVINGLIVNGNLQVMSGNLGQLEAAHCTFLPGKNMEDDAVILAETASDLPPGEEGRADNMKSVLAEGGITFSNSGQIRVMAGEEAGKGNSSLKLILSRLISGPVILPQRGGAQTLPDLKISDSLIISGVEPSFTLPAIEAGGTRVELEKVTVFGTVSARSLEASNVIFMGSVRSLQHQAGCVRFSFVPDKSETPRRFRCQPELEITSQVEKLEQQKKARATQTEIDALTAEVKGWLLPSFTRQQYYYPGFGQLGPACPIQIRTGADNGSEMGAFSFLQQPQRDANLRASLDEYLRFGLEAGILYVT